MPTYVYRREDGTTFEVQQRITEDALTVCPETGQPVERVIGGGAGLIFKGSGFYLTDYARAGKGNGAKADSAPASDSTAGAAKPSTNDGGSAAAPSAKPADSKSD